MKNSRLALILAVALAGALTAAIPSTQQARTAEHLLGAALHQDEVEGDLEAAIETYKKLLAEYPDNRPIAARALFQMGRCYERLGNAEARKAYERLLRDYADQSEQARLARVRLAELRKPAVAGKEQAFATRQVWAGSDVDIEGAPSPDGRYLSFVDWETGDLAVRDLETGTNRRLTDKGPWEKSDEFAEFSRFSPDGKSIAYDWYDGGCCVDLYVIARDGGKPRRLVDYEDGEWMQTFDWSPDGRQILTFLEKKDGGGQILLVSAADGSTRLVKSFNERGHFPHAMRFSRDGQYIAYDQPNEENAPERDILLLAADGSREITLVKHPADDRLLGWPPDGKGLLFASDRTGSLDMWFLPVSGGRAQGPPEYVKGGVDEILPLGFAQNGSFFYAQGRSMLDIYVARMDPESGRILAPPEKEIKSFEGANSWPDYSPDGKSLAYVSTRSHSFQSALRPNILFVRSLETGAEREYRTEFRRLARPCWTPDGRFIYLGAWDNRGMGIYRVDPRTGEFTSVVRAELPARLHWHEITPDGKTMIHGRRDKPKEPYRILSRNLATGEEKQLYADPDRTMFSVSPDGRFLALINVDKKKIVQIMPASGGEPKVLLRFDEEQNYWSSIDWTSDGKHLVFPRMHSPGDSPRFALWRIAAAGGEPQELGLVMAHFQSLIAHPDGTRLTFDSMGSTRRRPAIWVMENFLPSAGTAK